MHFPIRAFVSESQREVFVAGLGSEFEDRGGVVDRDRRREDWGILAFLGEVKIEERSRIFILRVYEEFGSNWRYGRN